MTTCKTCRHWAAPDHHLAERICRPLDPDTYAPMALGFEVRVCKMPTQGLFETPTERDGFSLTDSSEWFAVLATAEDFGCVRHEPAETVAAR